MINPAPELSPDAKQANLLAMHSIWRASELAVSTAKTHSTGHPRLDSELPNGGWPRSSSIEVLVQQHGVGEMQLLKPILASLAQNKRIALIQPPYLPHSMTCRSWQIDDRHVLWIRPTSSADALWAAEQVLKNGSCGAVLLWQSNVRNEALRRLNLAAQSAETWMWLMRPMAAAVDASPSPLRIALRPAPGGVQADIVKRKGPHCEQPFFVPLPDMPTTLQPNIVRESHVPVRAGSFTAKAAATVLV